MTLIIFLKVKVTEGSKC